MENNNNNNNNNNPIMNPSLDRRFSFSNNHPIVQPAADGSWSNSNRWQQQQQQQQQQESHVAAAGRQPVLVDPHAASNTNNHPSASHHQQHRHSSNTNEDSQVFVWTRLLSPTSTTASSLSSSSSSSSSDIPPPRSGAASVVLDNRLYVFGGYGGGTGRLEDFYAYDFAQHRWQPAPVHPESPRPGCRENNGVVIADEPSRSIYLFGGYNGQEWLNDLWKYSVDTQRWTCLQESTRDDTTNNNQNMNDDDPTSLAAAGEAARVAAAEDHHNSTSSSSAVVIRGQAPSRRFGFVSVVHDGRFIVFGGFDGSRWLNDMHCFAFATSTWTQIEQPRATQHTTICWPSARSCPAWAKDDRYVYIQGGYDGLERKSDFFALDMTTYTWREMPSWGSPPSPRYFHSCGLYGNKLYLFGGYSGSERLADLYVYDLETQHWSRIDARGGDIPSGRSSLVLQVHEAHLWIFAGYDGSRVMNDFYKFRLKPINLPSTSLVQDLAKLIHNPDLADVKFLVEGKTVFANRAILAIRSEYFRVMLCGGMRESSAVEDDDDENDNRKVSATGDEISLPEVSYEVFLRVLEFIYTDNLSGELSLEVGIHLLIASELFMLDRLKALCENLIRRYISVDSVTDILVAAHRHNAAGLKDLALEFILYNLNDSIVMDGLGGLKSEPDLLLEIIRRNSTSQNSGVQQHNILPNNNSSNRRHSALSTTRAGNIAGALRGDQNLDLYYVPGGDGRMMEARFLNNNNDNNNNQWNRHFADDRSHLVGAGGAAALPQPEGRNNNA